MSQYLRTITKISKQKKISDRYNIYLDETYAFSVNEDVFIAFNLHKGLSLSETDIAQIQDHDSLHRSYLQAIHFLSYRMRSKQEIRTYLQKKDVNSTIIEEILIKLEKEKYLNDLEFANVFVRDRMNHSSKGPRLITKELREKGVELELINQAMEQYDYEKQFEVALKWAQKQRRKKNNQSYQKQNEQLKINLTQKGFTSDVVNDVFLETKEMMDETEELAALKFHADKLFRRHKKKYKGQELIMKVKNGLYQRGFQGNLINEYVAKIEEEM